MDSKFSRVISLNIYLDDIKPLKVDKMGWNYISM